MRCSATVATSSSWAGVRVRGAHPGEAAHARRVALLSTPATVGAEMAPPRSIATCSSAWRRLIEVRLTASLPPSQMAIPRYPSQTAPESRCRLAARTTLRTPLRDGRTPCNIGRGQREMTRTGRVAQETIDRREALRRAALLLGGALAAPTVAGVLAGCRAARVPDGVWAPRALTRAQVDLVAAIAD